MRKTNSLLRFIVCHFSFLIFFMIPYVFINTFLLSLSSDSDIYIIVLYNIFTYLLTPVSMHIATVVSAKLPIKRVAQMGIVMYCMVYALLAVFKERVIGFYPVIGILMGCAAGFYWLCYNVMLDVLLNDNNRDKAIGLITVFYCIISLTAPMASGWLISAMPGNTGYTVVFGFSLVVAVITAFLLNLLPDTKNENIQKHPFKKAYSALFKNKAWRNSLFSTYFLGVREGAIQFILAIMIFKLVSDEFLVGINSFASGAGAALASLIISFLVKPKNRIGYMTASVTILTLCSLGFLYCAVFNPSAVTFEEAIIIFGAAGGFLQIFITNPVTAIAYYALDTLSDLGELRNQYLAMREVFLDLGRATGAVLFLLMPSDIISMTAAILIMSLAQYITVLFCKRTLK